MKPETSLSYDFGVYHRFGKSFNLRATGNYVNTSNYLVTDTDSIYYSGESYAYSLDIMRFYGAEVEFNWAPSEKLVLFGNYSYLHNHYTADKDLPYAMILDLPPKSKGNLSVRYSLPFKTRFGFNAKFVGERKTEGGYKLGRYALADISLDRTFAERISAGFFINNLFGMDYQQVYGYPAAGITWGIRFKVSAEKSLLAR